MPLNKVIFSNNSQNKDSFLKVGNSSGPGIGMENLSVPIITTTPEAIPLPSVDYKTLPLTTSIGSKPSILSPNIKKTEIARTYVTEQAQTSKFSSRLLNYTEPYEVGGVRKTAFYSEISTNYKVGDRVFIINGNFDSHDAILGDKYSKGSDGYKVLAIDGCKVVLDIDFVEVNPYNSPIDIDELIFVHNVTGSQELYDHASTLKTYITDTTIAGELVSLFQGRITNGVLRTWTGNILFSGDQLPSEDNVMDTFDRTPSVPITSPTLSPAFWVKDSTSAGAWINVDNLIATNKIRLMDQTSNPTGNIGNKKLYILGEDFTWNGMNFQERQIYKFDDKTSKWVVDRSSKPAIITASYFKYGKFLGEHISGLYGSYIKKNNWRNAKWKNGTMINTIWNSGFLDSKTKVGEKITRATLLYDQLSIPYVSQVVDSTNNSGYGYNLVIDSDIKEGILKQATFENCNVGQSIGYVLDSYYKKTSFLGKITANFCKFIFSDIKSSLLSSCITSDSNITNSSMKLTKALNSQIFSSLFDGGEYNTDSGITILGAELNSWDQRLSTFNDDTDLIGVLKLFISDEDFFRIEKNDTFYIERVNKEFFIGGLDTEGKINLPYETKYLLNLYWDLEFSARPSSRQAVSLKDKRANRNRFYVRRSTAAQTQQLNAPRTTAINGITYWKDVTARFEGANRTTPGFDPTWTPESSQLGPNGRWFYYTREITQSELTQTTGGGGYYNPRTGEFMPELPAVEVPVDAPASADLFNPQTTHIFYYLSNVVVDPINSDGFNLGFPYERVFTNANGPLDPLSQGQFRGDWQVGISDIFSRVPLGGSVDYQINDVVRFWNPQLEKWEYYQSLVSHSPSQVSDSYVPRTFTLGGANSKILYSEQSKYRNYCSIDIESRVFGWYDDIIGNKSNPIYTYNRDDESKGIPFKPNLNKSLPIGLVDKIFKDVIIKNGNFNSGLFINAKWVSGSLIEDFDNTIENLRFIFDGQNKLNMYKNQSGGINVYLRSRDYGGVAIPLYVKTIQPGDKVWLNSITNEHLTTKHQVEGRYEFAAIDGTDQTYILNPENVDLNPITEGINSSGFISMVGTYSVTNAETMNYASLHRVLIENSTITSGTFKRVYFKNSKITNRVPFVKPNNFDFLPSVLPKMIQVLFARNSNLVENGLIYNSHITNITNTGGYFIRCYWNGATFSNGEFQEGYWINGTFENGKFYDSKDISFYYSFPQQKNFRFNSIEYVLPIYFAEGFTFPFDYGDFEASTYFDILMKPIRKIWMNGVFNGGEFYNSYWIDGTFSNGKFWRSNWFGGDWNNGIFGDPSIRYSETTFGSQKQFLLPNVSLSVWAFNKNPGDPYYPNRLLGRTHSKWFGGEVQNGLVGGQGVVHWYNGQMTSGEFTSASASVNNQSIWYDGTFFGSIFSEFAQWKKGIFNSGKFRSIYGWEEQTNILDSKNTTVFSWESGIFNGGEFGIGSMTGNSLWKTGEFTNGLFQGRIWADGVFSGGLFLGSGATYASGTPSVVNNTRENEYYLSFAGSKNPATLPANTDSRGEFFGNWLNGVVSDRRFTYTTAEKISTRLKRSTDRSENRIRVSFQNVLWRDGLFDHENGTIQNSLFCAGTFSNGVFDGGVFNPYLDRTYTFGENFTFERTKINWERGIFKTGSFYASEWKNGLFKNGYMSGAYWRNGIWEYGTAENIFWDGGTWKNGNWDGAPFNYLNVATGPGEFGSAGFSYSVRKGRALDILLRTDKFMRDSYGNDFKVSDANSRSYVYVSNVFSASPTTTNFGISPPNYLRLRQPDYFDLWLPYQIQNDATGNFPKPIGWTTFRTDALAAGSIKFWYSTQQYNFSTASYHNAAGGNALGSKSYETIHSGVIAASNPFNGISEDPIWTLTGGALVAALSTNVPNDFVSYVNDNPPSLPNGLKVEASTEPFPNASNIVGVRLRFTNYRNNPNVNVPFSPFPAIQVQLGTTAKYYGWIYDKQSGLSVERQGWATSSFFGVENNYPFPAKPFFENYLARDFVPTQQFGNSIAEPKYQIITKTCSQWEEIDEIPFYWDGTYNNDVNGNPDLNNPKIVSLSNISSGISSTIRNFRNIYTTFSPYYELPNPVPETNVTINKYPRGYNTFPKRYFGDGLFTVPEDNVDNNFAGLVSGFIPNSAPSHKIYARFQTLYEYKLKKIISKPVADALITVINNQRTNVNTANYAFKNFNGATGSRTGIYIWDKNRFTAPGQAWRLAGQQIGLPVNAIGANDYTGLIDYISDISTGAPEPADGPKFIVNGGIIQHESGSSANDKIELNITIQSLTSSILELSGAVMITAAGPPQTPFEFDYRRLNHPQGGGADIYQPVYNEASRSYDVLQYFTEIEVSVELEKEVSFDVWMAGASYSSFTLKSKECVYGSSEGVLSNPRRSYFPSFYRLKFNYLTTPENIYNPDEDKNRFWIKKTSFGILRIYSWRVSVRKIEYNFDYNNKLYSSVDQAKGFIGLPATPSVVLSLPTSNGPENSFVYGNGLFRQGIWENGVWNGGYRYNDAGVGFFYGDDILKANDITFAVRRSSKDTIWSIKIILVDSLSNYTLKFDIGTRIAVSNLAAYDNSDRRMVISSILEIENYSFDENSITVKYKSPTPISYIKKDSENHLIYLTTNVWSNGAFLNGVFRGVWNNGLFKGNVFLTEMFDSHFIDGAFEGGHFKSVEMKEGMSAYKRHNTGLIQNFRFKALNVGSPNPTWETRYISDIRNQFQSWIDVVYSTQSKVNLKNDTTQLRAKEFIPLMIGTEKADAVYFSAYEGTFQEDGVTPNFNIGGWKPRITSTVLNKPNLQGLPTADVLSSYSEFRDFQTNTKRVYKLGTKRQVYSNLLPNNGNFEKPIASNATFSRLLLGQYRLIGQIAPSLETIGFTFSTLWQRVGTNYIPPGFAGSQPKTWDVVQYGHGDFDTPLNYSPKEIKVTFGDQIRFYLNDLRKPALIAGYSYNVLGDGPWPNYNAVQCNENNTSMYPFNTFDKSCTDPIFSVPTQLFTNLDTGYSWGTQRKSNIYGWNAFDTTRIGTLGNAGGPFGGEPPIASPGPLGNRIALVTGYGSNIICNGSLTTTTKDDDTNAVLAWAWHDGGYAYPQARSINTGNGMRYEYLNGTTPVTGLGTVPIKTNQNSSRSGPGDEGASPRTNGLTHGVHYFINMSKLIDSRIIYDDFNPAIMTKILDLGGVRDDIVNSWKQRLNASGVDGNRRYNPTRFNPYSAFGKITVLPVPSPVWTKNLPANYYYDSNTDALNDNVLRLTIGDYLQVGAATATPLNWAHLLQNKTITPIPNRYYELSIDVTYYMRMPSTATPPSYDGFYQGLFLDDIYENLDQDSNNGGLPPVNIHQYTNHFYNGKVTRVSETDYRLTVTTTEYFMNKNNVDILFYNNFAQRGGPLSMNISNISLNEVDMLPFFSYFSASLWDTHPYYAGDPNRENGRARFVPNQIDVSPKIPLKATSPQYDLSNPNFSFTDNLSLSITTKALEKTSSNIEDQNSALNQTTSEFEKGDGTVTEGGGGVGTGG